MSLRSFSLLFCLPFDSWKLLFWDVSLWKNWMLHHNCSWFLIGCHTVVKSSFHRKFFTLPEDKWWFFLLQLCCIFLSFLHNVVNLASSSKNLLEIYKYSFIAKKNTKYCFLGWGRNTSWSMFAVFIENTFWIGLISMESSCTEQGHPAMWKKAWLSASKVHAWSKLKSLM